MEPSIFTRIINGEIPCHKIYEDDKTLAFLDIHPTQPGHTLVIPKKQVEFAWDLDDEDYRALTDSVKKVALRLRDVLKTKYVGQKIFGTDVPHTHIHLIPFSEPHEFNNPGRMDSEPDHTSLAEMAEKLRF